jgi:hypothetical protein
MNNEKLVMGHSVTELYNDYIKTKSGHFFDDATMDFFASKLRFDFRRLSDQSALFITSEKKGFDDHHRTNNLRIATIRDGKININTVQRDLHLHQAKKMMANYKTEEV